MPEAQRPEGYEFASASGLAQEVMKLRTKALWSLWSRTYRA